ncbi:hypothetical protein DLJ59_07920 [Micromonospora inaquosa]|uniref:AMP-binding enzyme C-terminal domain-containing protein n=1 Tax=Micromonospora inaquosa TaxID=2203716 RepID=A0A3N9WX49_9ACTN|nr:hypothetical protein DLJ59_07920 [Micromonospora inaquosa]
MPIGVPVDSARLLIVGDEGEVVDDDRVGELFIGGSCLALGYLNDAAATRSRFTTVAGQARRWYRSGDLVRRDAAGDLHFVGRVDRQIKVNGARVEPGEVEFVLRQHPLVADAVVDMDAGTGHLVAYVTLVGAGVEGPGDAEFRRLMAARLPAQMVPKQFIVIDAMPLTPHGKIDTRSLARRG